jgi:glycosyltransferase involved in cell wall biosynthesis
MPTVSVVIPTYNNAALLHETLNGVLRQTVQDLEVLVVDDGSTDDTEAVVRRYDSRFRYIKQANQGPAAARNTGAQRALGEYIAFLDHDDIWNEQHLATLLDSFDMFPQAGMVFDDVEYFGDGLATGSTHIDRKVVGSMVDRPVPIRRIWQCWVASMSVVMVRKSIFDELGGLNPAIWGLDDLHFYLRLAAHWEIRFAAYVGCRKRVCESNLLPSVGLKGLVDCLEDLQKHNPEVMRAMGPVKFRVRLARKQNKLALMYLRDHKSRAARDLLWKAYKQNPSNLVYLWRLFHSKRSTDRIADGR